ncbi:MAG: hypothetical protein KF708_18965 [Pirellulales bacterium]|nr:hypothetical protein [Pirellulales bacterium]
MTDAVQQPRRPRRLVDVHDATELKGSRYDSAASWLISLLMLTGILVVALVLIRLSQRLPSGEPAVEVVIEELGGGGGGREDGFPGETLDFESPNADVIAGESQLAETQIEQTLATVSTVVSSLQAELPDLTYTEQFVPGEGGRSEGNSRRPGRGTGGGTGSGDGIGWGSGSGPGGGGRSRAERWEIFYQDGGTLEEYARQLDFFKVELGVIGGTAEVQYAYNLTKPIPDKRTGPGQDEKRLYMSWRKGSLLQADQELLTRAGISHTGRIVVQFYPAETENLLARAERDFRGLEASRIRKTRFGVRPSKTGFEFFVLDQLAF